MTSMFEQQLDLQNLSEEDKAFLRSWNRHDLIPAEDAAPAQETTQEPTGGQEPAPNTPETPPSQENPQESQGGASGDDPDGDGDDDSDYSEWSNDELAAELQERGLPKSGNKAELIARLEADDAS